MKKIDIVILSLYLFSLVVLYVKYNDLFISYTIISIVIIIMIAGIYLLLIVIKDTIRDTTYRIRNKHNKHYRSKRRKR